MTKQGQRHGRQACGSTGCRRVALVTGAARRIGRACALALAEAGYDLALHYFRSRREADALAVRVRRMGARAWLVQGDLTRAGQAAIVFGRAVSQAGRVDLLVNNASLYEEDTPRCSAGARRNLAIHAVSPLVLSCGLAAQGGNGGVINVLDARLFRPDPKRRAYLKSKRMLYALTKEMAVEFAPRVRVNGVAPGAILPPPGMASKTALNAYRRRVARANLLGRMGTPEDVARAVVYLAGAEFVTGQVLFVDGGYGVGGRRRTRGGVGKGSSRS